VQFRLKALQTGQISVEQFGDLNNKIGGVDRPGLEPLGRPPRSRSH
jgi:hypothetical protein